MSNATTIADEIMLSNGGPGEAGFSVFEATKSPGPYLMDLLFCHQSGDYHKMLADLVHILPIMALAISVLIAMCTRSIADSINIG